MSARKVLPIGVTLDGLLTVGMDVMVDVETETNGN